MQSNDGREMDDVFKKKVLKFLFLCQEANLMVIPTCKDLQELQILNDSANEKRLNGNFYD